MNALSIRSQRPPGYSCWQQVSLIPSQTATVAKLRLLAARATRPAQNDTIAAQVQPQAQSCSSDPTPAALGVSGAAEELQAGTTAADAPSAVAAHSQPHSQTAAATAVVLAEQQTDAGAVVQQLNAEQDSGRWPLQQQLQGLLSGPCLVAAGALACSFISLQVKLFDQHVPPLQVTACSSAVAWLATSVILGQQQWSPQKQQRQQGGTQPVASLPQQTVAASGDSPAAVAAAASGGGPTAAASGDSPGAAAAAATGGSAAASVGSAAGAAASRPSLAPSTSSLLLLRGLLGAATVTAYYAAVEELPLSVAVALFFFHPVLALLLNSAVSGAKVAPQAASSCALTVLGVLVIGWHDQLMLHLEQAAVFIEVLGREGFEGATAAAAAAGQEIIMGPELSLYGVVMGLIAAAANAAAFVVVGLIGKEVSPVSVCWWQYCVTTHAAVAVILLSQLESAVMQASVASGSLDPWSIDPNSSLGVLSSMADSTSSGLGSSLYGISDNASGLAAAADGGLGFETLQQLAQDSILQMQQSLPNQHDALLLSGVVVANFLGQLLLNAGFQRVDAGRGAAVNTLQVLFANVWDVLLLHSAASGGILVGSGMIAAGVVGTRQSASDDSQPPHHHQQQHQQQHLSQR